MSIPTEGLSLGVATFVTGPASFAVSWRLVLVLNTLSGWGVLVVAVEVSSGEELMVALGGGMLSSTWNGLMATFSSGSGPSGESLNWGGVRRGLRRRGENLEDSFWVG